jgi:hypothetical protein
VGAPSRCASRPEDPFVGVLVHGRCLMPLKPLSPALLVLAAALCSAAPSPRVAADSRSLEYPDGRPFLWLGDTAWELFHRLDDAATRHYLEHRARHGYTVIQAVLLAENDGLRTPNALGDLPLIDLDPTRPNEAYFRFVDRVVARAGELGLVMGLLPTWGDKVPNANPGAGPVVFNPANAEVYGRFLGTRYRDATVIWILGGDRNVDSPEALEIWRAMAKGIRAGDGGRHLISYHPRGEAASSYWLHHEPWLDLHLYQSGHGRRFQPVTRFARMQRDYRPAKPVVDAEPAYEDIAVRFWEYCDWNQPERVPSGVLAPDGRIARPEHFAQGFFTAHDVRVHAYWNLLSGAAGYTYGNNALWQMWAPGVPIAIPCLVPWREALERPGSLQMMHVRRLFERFPIRTLEPDPSLIFGPNPEGPDWAASARSPDGSGALLYLPRGAAVTVNPAALRGREIRLSWYDPRTGGEHADRTVPLATPFEVRPPASGEGLDWVCILECIR